MSYDTKWIRKVNCLLGKRIAKSNQTVVIHKTWISILLLLFLELNSPHAFAAQASEDTLASSVQGATGQWKRKNCACPTLVLGLSRRVGCVGEIGLRRTQNGFLAYDLRGRCLD